jgi:hypothetical protein
MAEQQTATPVGGQQGTQDSPTIRKLREEVRRVNEVNKKNRLSKGSTRTGGRS